MNERRPSGRPEAGPAASEDRLGARLARYAKVSGALAGQAAKHAARRATGRISPAEEARELREVLGALRGPIVKVAQMLATLPDVLPEEYAEELAKLQSRAPPMGRPLVRRRMAAELGPNWREHFAWFDEEPAAAASLGQVHRAMLKDGRLVACKLQYPDMEAAVEADLRQLRLLLRAWRLLDRAIDPKHVFEEIAERLREELDYLREARHMALYGEMLAPEPRVRVPEPVFELTTKRLLVMTWLEGRPLLSFHAAPQEVRDDLAARLFRAWYRPFYEYGVVHGDPHPGNYTVSPEGDLNLMDFGCVRIFPPEFVEGVVELYHALRTGDRQRVRRAYRLWGFTELSDELMDILNEWAAYLYGPLMDDRPRLVDETGSTRLGRQVVARVHRRLEEVGGVAPPREFVYMDRAAIGLGAVFLRLRAVVNWHRLFLDLLSLYDPEALRRRQAEALARHGLPPPPPPGGTAPAAEKEDRDG